MSYFLTTELKKSIKKTLGRGYAREIQQYLTANNLLNTKSEPYSEASIRVMFDQKFSHKKVFASVLKLYAIRKRQKQKELLEIQQLLKDVV